MARLGLLSNIMNRQAFRNRQPVRRSRRLTAFASLLWLNLAMLPCTMAADDDRGCPGCPPDHAETHAESHSGHHEHAADVTHHHAEEPAADRSHCGLDERDCCDLDELSVDDRPQNPKADSNVVAAVHFDTGFPQVADKAPACRLATGPPRSTNGSARLHAINCVYLD